MKTLMLIFAVAAAAGVLWEVPGDKLSEAMQAKPQRADEETLVAQCGTMQYAPYGAGDCSASQAAAFGAYGAECAQSPSAYGYVPYGVQPSYGYRYVPTYQPQSYGYAPSYYGGAYYAPRYAQPYGYGFRAGFGFGW